jgi:hypothetical protein
MFMRVYEEVTGNDTYELKAELFVVFTKLKHIIQLENMNAGQMVFELVSCFYAFLRNNMLFGYENTTKDGCIEINKQKFILKEITALQNGDQQAEIGLCFTNEQNILPRFLYKTMGVRKILPSDMEKEYVMYTSFPQQIENTIKTLCKLQCLFPERVGKSIPSIVDVESLKTSQQRMMKRIIFSPNSEKCDYFFTHLSNDSLKIVTIFDLFIQFIDIIQTVHSASIVHKNICIQNMMLTLVSIHNYSPTNKRQAILFGWENAQEYEIHSPELKDHKIQDLMAFCDIFDVYMLSQKQYSYKEKIKKLVQELDYNGIKTIIQCIHGTYTC